MIRPTLDRIAIRQFTRKDEKTAGGIVVPALAPDLKLVTAPYLWGEVVAVGPLVKSDIRPGDIVAISPDYRQDPRKYGPPSIRSMGEFLIVVHEETVCGVESAPDPVDNACPRCGAHVDVSAHDPRDIAYALRQYHPPAVCNERYAAQEAEREAKASASLAEMRNVSGAA